MRKRREVDWGEAAVPIGLTIYCLLYVIQVRGISIKSTGYPYFLIGMILLFLIAIFWKFVRREPMEKPAGESQEALLTLNQRMWAFARRSYKAISLIVGTFVYSLLSPALGFTFTTMLFMGVTLRIFGVRNIPLLLLFSVGYAFFLFSLMTFYLRITLPAFAFADLPFGL